MRGVLSVLLRGVIAQRLCKRSSGEGRVAVMEILHQNWAISNMIRENKIHQLEGYLQSVNYAKTGMVSMDMNIFQQIRDGSITIEEGLRVADHPEIVRSLCEELPEEL